MRAPDESVSSPRDLRYSYESARLYRGAGSQAGPWRSTGACENMRCVPHGFARDRGRTRSAQISCHPRPSDRWGDCRVGRGRKTIPSRHARRYPLASSGGRQLRVLSRRHENLCDNLSFTGYTVDGGFAEYAVAPEDFVYPIPEGFPDEQAAPLLCAGIIGFRCLRLAGVKKGSRLGFYGFGSAAHVAIQVALHWGVEVYASTRGEKHQQLAKKLGAVWTGDALAVPPVKLDAGIVFAPAGEIVPPALKALKKGGVLILGGIHMSPIPQFDYDLLYQERVIRSVANNTRADGNNFLRVAAEIPIRTQVKTYPLHEANIALNDLKADRINGSAVLDCS